MTLEQQQSLSRELRDATESGDAVRIHQAHVNALIALLDCQRKTSDRVKKILWFGVGIVLVAVSGGNPLVQKLIQLFGVL